METWSGKMISDRFEADAKVYHEPPKDRPGDWWGEAKTYDINGNMADLTYCHTNIGNIFIKNITVMPDGIYIEFRGDGKPNLDI